MSINATSLFNFSRSNWFKIFLVILLFLTLIRKDFSFRVQLNGATKKTAPIHKKAYKNVASKKLILSDRNQLATTETLSIVPFGGEGSQSMTEGFWKIEKKKHLAFIKRFKKVAKAEGAKFGIPPSIILANGLLLSGAGTYDVATKGNNYFAIPCTADWQGETQEIGGVCYRIYDRAWTSFRDHSFYLTTNLNVTFADVLPSKDDDKGWAALLETVGFVSNKESILRIIEEYQLED